MPPDARCVRAMTPSREKGKSAAAKLTRGNLRDLFPSASAALQPPAYNSYLILR